VKYQKRLLGLCVPSGALRGPSWLGGVALALLAGGCSLEDVNSDAVRTQGIHAQILAIAPGDATTLVRVDLAVGGENGTVVNLVAPDQLTASMGEAASVKLVPTSEGRYEARLEGDAAAEITVRLERGSPDLPASMTLLLPEPFALELDTDRSAGIDRATPVNVSWNGSAASQALILWSVEGRCIWSDSGVTPDDGSLRLDASKFRARSTRAGEECEVKLTLDRSNAGTVDPVLVPSSTFRAVQRRGVSFISTPAPTETGAAPFGSDTGR
jgi:hypothetical protein